MKNRSEAALAAIDARAPGSRTCSALHILDWLERRVLWNVGAILLLVAAVFMLSEALGRTFFNESQAWLEEALRYMVIWAVFLVFGFASREGHYVRTTLVVQHLPRRVRRFLDYFNCAGGLLFSVTLLWAAFIEVQNLHRLGITGEALLVPLWIVKTSLIAGAFSLFAYFLYSISRVLKGKSAFTGSGESASHD